ncbi:molybdate ABC transporter substrate-binding protein [Undibacterium sp. Ren11W]|uniref:molybdate ABC transporter substrate-binding protein n=1 Tax=Undibacterium sp. Ren11W TaxID=3413045 RepID=UPI003BF43E06
MPFKTSFSQRIFALFSLLFSSQYSNYAAADTLSVAVAANVQYVFDEIKLEFKKESGHELLATYNSSGKFVTQILNGAPFDVFLSADMEYPDYLNKQSYTTVPPKAYAYGSLVLWSMKKQDLSQWQSIISGNTVSKIALANPKTAPYGREAMRSLAYFKLDVSLKPRLVFGDSISQTNQYIHSGVADIGFTAKSVVLAKEMKDQGSWIEVPQESYQAIAQGAVILKHGKESNPVLAQQFYDFLYSAKARAIFQKNGYTVP